MKRVKNADNQKYLDTLKVCMGLNDIEGEDILRTSAIDLKKYIYDINKLFDNSFKNKDNIEFILQI